MDNLKEKILQGTLRSLETFSINKLKNIINKSEKEKREYGLLFCGSTDEPPFGNLSHAELCTGKECTVEIHDCKGKQQIGSFHTHPHSETGKDFGNLSGKDIYESVSHRHGFSCIGTIENNKSIIKCFTPALDIDPIITLKAYKAQDDYGRKLSRASQEKSIKYINELIESYDKRIIADDELYQESEALAKRLQFKGADLTIIR